MNTRFFAHSLLYFIAHLHHGLPINSVSKILGGFDMSIESVPYVLSLMLNGEYVCCAVIINKYWAATAAHCVRAAKHPCKEISLRSGSSFLYQGGIIHNVVDVTVHENYNDLTNDYDIAVVKITPSFRYNDFTRPVVLAQSDAKDVCTAWGMVCGWGYYMEGAFDSCKGDSGSALINKDGVLLGITSWGNGCGEPYSPGVYIDAILLRNWIRDKTGRLDTVDPTAATKFCCALGGAEHNG
ncbi:trypsin-7-like isoform X3 [Odontomachus brunneus]|uniref:trypsin-7-like isoform X3 n=1 Tax=Odontomachus brunneus TaxID=486640 RepID=UPI0013F25FDD|nr:trypsin-7-like isoform X3 [Odontomachus brunneus]